MIESVDLVCLNLGDFIKGLNLRILWRFYLFKKERKKRILWRLQLSKKSYPVHNVSTFAEFGRNDWSTVLSPNFFFGEIDFQTWTHDLLLLVEGTCHCSKAQPFRFQLSSQENFPFTEEYRKLHSFVFLVFRNRKKYSGHSIELWPYFVGVH